MSSGEEAVHVQGSGPPDARDAASDLQTVLVAAAEVESFLGEVARRAAAVVRRAQSCGTTVQGSASSLVLGATTDELAYRMDAVQYEIDDGPCLTCLRRGDPVSVPDIHSDRRWPASARRGAQEGAGSSLSVPLVVQDKTVGALNLYSRSAHGLSEADRTRATEFARHAAAVVALAAQRADHELRELHLENALRSRSMIDPAMGVLMGQARVSAAEAFEMLRRRSQHSNTKLRDVAATVVADATQHR
jgi:GAF domain-containing protein